jgi:hypothetical protein
MIAALLGLPLMAVAVTVAVRELLAWVVLG